MSSNTINIYKWANLCWIIHKSNSSWNSPSITSIVYQLSTGPRSLDDGAMPCSSWSPVPSVPCAATRRRCWESLRLQAEAADGEGLCWSWKPWNTARWNLPPGEQKFCFSDARSQWSQIFRIATLITFDFCKTRSLWEGYSMLFPNLLGRHVGYDGSPRMSLCVPLWSRQPQSSSTKLLPPPGPYPNCYMRFKEDLLLIYEIKKNTHLLIYTYNNKNI